jgi:hypothetical protein
MAKSCDPVMSSEKRKKKTKKLNPGGRGGKRRVKK